ncbi:MAG: hypothetical protein IH586_22725 [Anaerolineaceae bacterium]|nr:hypothetical protein [Anaerolineaceae bacterium]
MPKAKTAISIDPRLLEETGNVAQELDISRIQMIAQALEDYIRRYRNKQILSQINEAYSDSPDSDEAGSLEIIRSQRRRLGEDEGWK